MKKCLLIIPMAILGLCSCELNKDNNNPEIVFKIGKDLSYKYSDIDLYDSCTHILCFKDNHPEFDKTTMSTFAFLAEGTEVYSGSFWPAYFNSLPKGPFIFTPSFFQNYALRVEDLWPDDKPDVRNDPQLMQSLKNHNLLHSGLSVRINTPEINGTQLTFSFTVTNQDVSDLLILDLDKMGPNLFHYFTNGLIIRNTDNTSAFGSNIEVGTPSPWNSWKIEWLSSLKSGDSRQFSINYIISSPLSPGEYNAMFEFPGLSYQISREQLFMDGTRIWLGDVKASKKFTVQ